MQNFLLGCYRGTRPLALFLKMSAHEQVNSEWTHQMCKVAVDWITSITCDILLCLKQMVPKGDNTKELTNYKYSTSKVYLLFF